MVDKSLKLYNGSDLLPVNDYTDEDWTDWGQTELAMAADGGDSTASTWQLRDEGGVIPDRSGLSGSYFLEAHNVVKLTVGSNTLFNGRLGYDDRKQGRQPAAGVDTHSNKGRAVEFTVTLGDANEHLRGIIAHNFVRPEETDAARVQAVVAAYLSGSPRPSTNLNGSNYVVTGSNTFTVPPKTYSGVTPGEILQEIAELTDKQMFVDVNDNLHYHGNDYPWNAPIRISDDPTDLNAVTCVPIDASRSEESRDTLTALRVYWGNNTSGEQNTFQRVDATKMEANDYWEDVRFDSESTTWAEASNRASNAFVPRKLDQTSYTVTIGRPGSPNGEPWTSAEIALAPQAGQLIEFKALKARGGRATNGNWLGDTFLTRRIKEVRWTFPGPDAYYCQLILDRPRHSLLGTLPFHPPFAPDPGTPGTPPTAPTEDVRWSFTARGGASTTNLYEDGGTSYHFDGAGWNASGAGVGAYFGSDAMWWGDSGTSTQTGIPVTAGTDYTFGARLMQQQTNSGATFIIKWYNGLTYLSAETLLVGFPYHAPTSYTYVRTAPTGATRVRIYFDTAVGKQASADDIYIAHGGSGGTAGTPSTAAVTTVGGTGEGSYSDSGEYVPVGSVLEHDYITEGGPYHDADQIAVDAITGVLTGATDVQQALEVLSAFLDALGVAAVDSSSITAAPEGGWGRITKNNVVHYNGYTYIGYITGDDGDCRVAMVADTDPFTVVNTVTLHAALDIDDHSAPSLLVRSSDNKLVAVYSTHGDTTVRLRVSTTSLDTDPDLGDGFAAEQSLDANLGSSTYTYPSIFELTAESKLYLFVRAGGSGSSADWYYSTSTDDGATWAAVTKFFDESARWVYVKAAGNGVDRIDFVLNDGSPTTDLDVSTGHAYLTGGTFHASDGTALTAPFDGGDMTVIADGAIAETNLLDVAIDPDGNPVIAYADIEDTSHHIYHHAAWNGATWVDTEIVDSGPAIESSGTFSGHVALDPDDPTIVYASVQTAGQWEMYRYTTDGATWTGTALTSGSSSKNIRPAVAAGHSDDLRVVWLVGSYTDINTFSLGIWGVGAITLPVGEPIADAHIADTTDAHDASAISIVDAGGYFTGTDVEAALQEVAADVAGVSGGTGIGPILISDTPSTPLVFADLIQNEAQDDLVYADP